MLKLRAGEALAAPMQRRITGGLRDDPDARLHPGDTAPGCQDRARFDRRLDRGQHQDPPAVRAENALATRGQRQSNRYRLNVW